MLLGVAAVALSGCATDEKTPVGSGLAATETACVNLLKDLRVHCQQGLGDSRASTGIDCLSARLEFERRC